MRVTYAKEWTKEYLANLYQKQNNYLYRELLKSDKNYYFSQTQSEAMIKFLTQSKKSPWEKFLQTQYSIDLDDIYISQFILETYRNNIDKALYYFNLIPSSKLNQTFSYDPFHPNMRDITEFSNLESFKYEKPITQKLTIYDVLFKIKNLQTQIKNGTKLYENYFALGSVFYNISFYGTASNFYQDEKLLKEPELTKDFYFGQYEKLKIYTDYLRNCSVSKSYFEEALKRTNNKEEQARCLYFISKCERNQLEVNWFKNNISYPSYTFFFPKESFKKLKDEYSNTQFYKEIIKECGYFKSYVSKIKK